MGTTPAPRSPIRFVRSVALPLAAFVCLSVFAAAPAVQPALAQGRGPGGPPPQANSGGHRGGPPPRANNGDRGASAAPEQGRPAQGGERPGWGCGDRNHVHTGPPGNPDAASPCGAEAGVASPTGAPPTSTPVPTATVTGTPPASTPTTTPTSVSVQPTPTSVSVQPTPTSVSVQPTPTL
jgi:hypothetical protein